MRGKIRKQCWVLKHKMLLLICISCYKQLLNTGKQVKYLIIPTTLNKTYVSLIILGALTPFVTEYVVQYLFSNLLSKSSLEIIQFLTIQLANYIISKTCTVLTPQESLETDQGSFHSVNYGSYFIVN